MYVIYKITNNINGKIYIGKARDFLERVWQHKTNANSKSKRFQRTILYNSMRKHGIENFSFEIVEYCEQDQSNEREKYWIQELNSNDLKIGYNMSCGGNGGDLMSNHPNKEEIYKNKKKGVYTEEALMIMRKSPKQKLIEKYGTVIGEELFKQTCLKISQSKKGFKYTEESKKKMSLAKLGKHNSPESIEKIRQSTIKRYTISNDLVNEIIELYQIHNSLRKVVEVLNKKQIKTSRKRISQLLKDNNIQLNQSNKPKEKKII